MSEKLEWLDKWKSRDKAKGKRRQSARIPVSPELHTALKDMAYPTNMTFEQLLRYLLEMNGISSLKRGDAIKWGVDNQDSIIEWMKNHWANEDSD